MRIVENRKCSRLLWGVSFGLLVLMIRVNVLVSCSLEKLWALFFQYVILATKLRKNPDSRIRLSGFFIEMIKIVAIHSISTHSSL